VAAVAEQAEEGLVVARRHQLRSGDRLDLSFGVEGDGGATRLSIAARVIDIIPATSSRLRPSHSTRRMISRSLSGSFPKAACTASCSASITTCNSFGVALLSRQKRWLSVALAIVGVLGALLVYYDVTDIQGRLGDLESALAAVGIGLWMVGAGAVVTLAMGLEGLRGAKNPFRPAP
jgi:hypothetical protein